MAGFNPCYCWNLKDGCITVGIWTLTYALGSLAIFSWQTTVINDCRYTLTSRMTYYCPDYCPCQTYTRYSGGEHILVGLFVIQILNLIAAFFLLFASVALIYGIHTSSKYLVWPWFPCIAAAIICSLAYCVMWWAGDVTSYWLVLTVVEVIAVFINLYCLFCVIVQYRRIVRGYVQASEDDSVKNQQLIGYEYNPYRPGDTGVVTYAAPEKKVGADGGILNYMYEPEGPGRVQMYGKDPYGRHPGELVPYSAEPMTGQAPMQQDPNADPYPCSKSEMTEEWLNNVMKSRPEEPPKIPILDHPPSPGREGRYTRSKSLDALEKEGRERDKKKGMRSSKSKDSVTSKHSRRGGRRDSSSCSTCTSSSETETVESNRKGRSRSEGRHRDRRGSDSEDTGYSRSQADSDRKHRKHKHHHHKSHQDGHRKHQDGHRKHHHSSSHHRHRDKSDDDRRSRKRLRDVKREDKERKMQQQQQQEAAQSLDQPSGAGVTVGRPETSSSATGGVRIPTGAVPVFPFGAAAQPGAISIPQHIVIPPQPKGAPHQPQRFHINSEITISYSDRSAPGSDSEHRPGSGGPLRPTTAGTVGAGGPAVIMPASTPSPGPRQQTPPVPPPRNGGGNGSNSANTSGDSSKGYGSTAV